MSAPPRILVIEDDHAYRRICCLALKSAGFGVVAAANATEGRRTLAEASFDLVLTDLLMPDSEGIDAIARLSQDFPGMRVVVMSGGGTTAAEECLRMAPELGAAGVLRKPFTMEELIQAVHGALPGPTLIRNSAQP